MPCFSTDLACDEPPQGRPSKSKPIAIWLALLGGAFGAHRWYLHGIKDVMSWLYPPVSCLGLWGLWRAIHLGQDDLLSWLLLPLLGATLSSAMLQGIVLGLSDNEVWRQRYLSAPSNSLSNWVSVLGVVLCLMIGTGILLSTIVLSAQHYFEYQLNTQSEER